MSKVKANTTVCKSPIEENPYFSHGFSLDGLIHNLKGHPPQWAGGMLCKTEPLRLQAIKHQAENVVETANMGLRSLGEVLAVAIASGELDEGAASNAAWLVEFLAGISQMADVYASNAQYELDILKETDPAKKNPSIMTALGGSESRVEH